MPSAKHERALLGQPERRLHAAAAVVERAQPTGQLDARLDRAQLGLRGVAAPEQPRAVGLDPVPAHEEIDVADMVGLEDDERVGRERVDAVPGLARRRRWRKRVEQHAGAA
jgi:hypothetical protein